MTAPTPTRVRVLIADDSAFLRKVLRSILEADPQIEVCGEACDGREAVELARRLQPDVISMDVSMPLLDGLQATEAIMTGDPRPVVIMGTESQDSAGMALRALELGAIDFISKPASGLDIDMDTLRDELRRKLKMAARVQVIRTLRRTPLAPAPSASASLASASPDRFPVVVMAASTGGPAALLRLLAQFPPDFPAAVLVVQHMPASFVADFVQQLAEACVIGIKEARPAELLQPGMVYVCPGAHHLRLSSTGRILLDSGPRVNGYRPCADVTMESVAAYAASRATAVVLTGMGSDGARGALAVKRAGGHVIAQDEESSVIFGMPAEVIRAGAAHQVLPLDAIYAALEKRVSALGARAAVEARP